jgi:hypothetical protein
LEPDCRLLLTRDPLQLFRFEGAACFGFGATGPEKEIEPEF